MSEPVLKYVFAADGDSSTVKYPGGDGWFVAHGSTFGSGTCKLQYRILGVKWVDVDTTSGTPASFTADGAVRISLPPCELKVNLASSSSPAITSSVFADYAR